MASSIKLTNANGKILTITNPDSLTGDSHMNPTTTAYTIETVDDFGSVPSGYTTVIVKDSNRGGTFTWSATGTANGGTVFAGSSGYWNRQYSGAVNVKWFGAKGDGVTDDTVAIQNAVTNVNFIYFPTGTYMNTGNFDITNKTLFGDGKTSIIKLSGLNTNSIVFKNSGTNTTTWGGGGGFSISKLSIEGNWDGVTVNSITDIHSIGSLIKMYSAAEVRISELLITKSFGFGVFSYRLGYATILNSRVSTNGKNGIHLEAPSGSDAITSTSIIGCFINSNRGTYPAGGSNIAVGNGLSVAITNCVLEDADIGVLSFGYDNTSVSITESYMEAHSVSDIKLAGSGVDFVFTKNFLGSATNLDIVDKPFNQYVSIGNRTLEDTYALPNKLTQSGNVIIDSAAPVKTLNSIALTEGLWIVSVKYDGINASGTGNASNTQSYSLNTSESFAPFDSDEYITKKEYLPQVTNFIKVASGTMSIQVRILVPTTIYFYGGFDSISSTLVGVIKSRLSAVKINGYSSI